MRAYYCRRAFQPVCGTGRSSLHRGGKDHPRAPRTRAGLGDGLRRLGRLVEAPKREWKSCVPITDYRKDWRSLHYPAWFAHALVHNSSSVKNMGDDIDEGVGNVTRHVLDGKCYGTVGNGECSMGWLWAGWSDSELTGVGASHSFFFIVSCVNSWILKNYLADL